MTDDRFALLDSTQLRKWREQMGWTRNDLAQRAGIDAVTIWRIERGHDPRLSTWRQICAVFV